ncbi:hypothetical protein [Undibacterium flavidum]|uniref:Abi-like protein n=1 Tax=Undibacterium flavidum TaxID=2762297 RepID=A0ABR6Y6H9_9BURK|nr:hypothetical protein [Undibacterium flavidum]MBC3872222.1 hypothetical protein [Undibacterium flavidum]
MTRKKGSKNNIPFFEREKVGTTDAKDIRHLSRQTGDSPLASFLSIMLHQVNYLVWIDSRHKELIDLKKQGGARGPKDAIFKKYKWYAEQSTLLEAINAFELFYKNTFISLASALRSVIPTDQIKGNIDSKVLWSLRGRFSISSVIFEHQIFHDLTKIDECSNMLVKAKMYNPNNINSPMRKRILAIQAAFQIRHTLSHNQGKVTQSDRAKLVALGMEVEHGEVIDPTKEYLGKSIRDFLEVEAKSYTEWLLSETAKYIKNRSDSNEITLNIKLKERIEKYIGSHADLDALAWS